MTAAPEAPKQPKTKRRDAYVARINITIPLDMANADTLSEAIKAVNAIEATLPAGSTCEVFGTLGKV